MPKAGVEPARCCQHQILSLARLPISSLGHFLYSIIKFLSSNDEIGVYLRFRIRSHTPLVHHLGIFYIKFSISSNDEIGILYFYLGSQAPLLITWAFSIFNYQIRFWNKFRITYKEILAKTNYFSNSFFKSWFNSCGFALPFVSFIAWPTKNPNNLSFPDL